MSGNMLATVEEIGRRVSEEVCASIPVADYGLSPTNVRQLIEVGKLLSISGEAVPKVFRQKPGLCFAIAQKAARWRMDPWAVAQKSYVVNDVVAHEAQLIIALINTSGRLEESLDYEWFGEGQKLVCKVTGILRGGKARTYESPELGGILPKNSPLWKVDPRRQLAYWSARAWARLHTPEVIMGVESYDDHLDARGGLRDVTPSSPGKSGLLSRYAKPAHAIEGEAETIAERAARSARTDDEYLPDDLPPPERDHLLLLRDALAAAASSEDFDAALEEWHGAMAESDNGDLIDTGEKLIKLHELRLERVGTDEEWSQEHIDTSVADIMKDVAAETVDG